MKVTGARVTSPKASRGKAGIRKDVDATIYFYSRWEANMARLYTHLGISWVYAPTSFDIGGQMYTPDFYLPQTATYIEVKNFWSGYSRRRDEKFRAAYPDIRLEVILKDQYLELEARYAAFIPNWEYKNSRFSAD
jgi:predicted nuclease of restriction endonuclease-like RecB superfamily